MILDMLLYLILVLTCSNYDVNKLKYKGKNAKLKRRRPCSSKPELDQQ